MFKGEEFMTVVRENHNNLHIVELDDQPYDGSQLRSLWIAEQAALYGTALSVFQGPCDVEDHMVDLVDIQDNSFISSDLMLHYIIEIFGIGIIPTVLYQRLFVNAIATELRPYGPILVNGDDIFIDVVNTGGDPYQLPKLSVSIATVSPISGLIHIGLNIHSSGVPKGVIAGSLDYFDLPLDRFIFNTTTRMAEIYNSVLFASSKVKTV